MQSLQTHLLRRKELFVVRHSLRGLGELCVLPGERSSLLLHFLLLQELHALHVHRAGVELCVLLLLLAGRNCLLDRGGAQAVAECRSLLLPCRDCTKETGGRERIARIGGIA